MSARRVAAWTAFRLAWFVAGALTLLVIGCAVGRFAILPVNNPGPNARAHSGDLAFVVPVPQARVNPGDVIVVRADARQRPQLQHVASFPDSTTSNARFDAPHRGTSTIALPAHVWRLRVAIAYLGAVLRLLAGPIPSLALMALGVALLGAAEWERIRAWRCWQYRSGRFTAAATSIIALGVVGLLGAHAMMSASTSGNINVSTAAAFAPLPTCAWTGGAAVTVTWPAQGGAVGYDILRSDTSNGSYATVGSVDGVTLTYTDSTVNNGSHPQGTYYFKVRADLGGPTLTTRAVAAPTCPGFLNTYAGHTGGNNVDAISEPQTPSGLGIHGNTLYVTDAQGAIRSIDLTTGKESTIAGGLTPTESGDGGPADLANVSRPAGIAVDAGGNQYFAETGSHVVRRIDAGTGAISVYAGQAGVRCDTSTDVCGDGGDATSASLADPQGVAIDNNGDLFIADTTDNRIRKVDHNTGDISTVVGTGNPCAAATDACGDGGDATDADLSTPVGIAFDADNNMYISDAADHRVRKVLASDGSIVAFAGNGDIASWGNDGINTLLTSKYDTPLQMSNISSGGKAYTAEANGRIREIYLGNIQTVAGAGKNGPKGDMGPALNASIGTVGGLALFYDTKGLLISDQTNHELRLYDPKRGTISNYAGNGSACIPASDQCGDGPFALPGDLATNASLTPGAVAMTPSGYVFVVDPVAHKIRKITPTGTIGLVAGDGTACASPTDACGDGASAITAQINAPESITWDEDDQALYIADSGDRRIRKIEFAGPTLGVGNITTVAGTGDSGDTGDGGAATAAEFVHPSGVLYQSGVGLFVSDSGAHRVRLFTDGGNISAYAGDGTAGDSGDLGSATSAQLTAPASLAYNGATLVVLDTSIQRFRVVSGGTITGFGSGGGTFGGDGGAATAAQLSLPAGITFDNANNVLYIADAYDNRVRAVDQLGNISTVVGDGISDFVADNTNRIGLTFGIALDGDGYLYIADYANHRVRARAPNGDMSTLAGTGGTYANASSATDARFDDIRGLGVLANGDMLATDAGNGLVRLIDHSTTAVTTFAGGGANASWAGDGGLATSAQVGPTSALATDAYGNIFVSNGQNARLRQISPDGMIDTIAGTGSNIVSGDGGAASDASIGYPRAAAVAPDGTIYVSDESHAVVRKIATDGTITTYAGGGSCGTLGCGDGGNADDAVLGLPYDLAVGADETLYIADSFAHTIRAVDHATGHISTIAGDGTPGNDGDGGNATSARLNSPVALALDDANHVLYVADSAENRIRKIDLQSGVIDAFAGTGAQGDTGDGGDALLATLASPSGIAYDPDQDALYVADYGNQRIRSITNGNIDAFSGVSGGGSGFAGDGGSYVDPSVRFSSLSKIHIERSGAVTHALVFGDGSRLRRISFPDNNLRTVAGDGGNEYFGGDNQLPAQLNLSRPDAIAVNNDINTVYISDRLHHRVVSISGNGTTFAGGGGVCEPATAACGDGAFAQFAAVTDPAGLAIDSGGDVYIADESGCRIRRVSVGIISTYAGTGTCGTTGDGGDATSATLNYPVGLAFHNDDLYITERLGNVVRKVDHTTGHISTVAGDGGSTADGDGGDATAAGVPSPTAVAFEPSGDMLIAQAADGAAAIRKVDHLSGHISTVAGGAFTGFGGDLGGMQGGGFFRPDAFYIDGASNIYIAEGGIANSSDDSGTSRVRLIVGPI